MIVLGLTGGIGMGKSTTAQMFAQRGIPVWDADQAVHDLYAPGGAAVAPMAEILPETVENGGISRAALRVEIARNPSVLKQIEQIVHPLVAAHRKGFLNQQTADVVVLDIPLLFELGSEALCSYTLVVSAPAPVQKARVMARPGMTEAQFELILTKQMSDADKRARADFVIETTDLASAERQVDLILGEIRAKKSGAPHA